MALSVALFVNAAVVAAEPVNIEADQVTHAENGIVIATGHVVIQRISETLIADKVIYRTKQHILQATGHVSIRSARATINATSAELQTESKTGRMEHATITLAGGERLQAVHLKRIDDQRFEAEQIIYSSCPIDEESWRIAASHALLDQEKGSLSTRNVRFELWQVPVLYTPWSELPLRRKSGFLTPYAATGKRRGTELALPYYMAPSDNWDATLTPHSMSARGFMGEAELRHISPIGHEKIDAAAINDRVTGRLRGRLQSDIAWQLPAAAKLSINADHISDRDYLADYGNHINSSSRYLQSNATLSQHLQWGKSQTDWFLQAEHQQDLLGASNSSTLQILPRLQSSSQWQPHANFIAHFDQQTTRFNRRQGVNGYRMDLHPFIELPWESTSGAINATFNSGLHHTRYWLQQSPLTNRQPTRTTAEASLEVRSDFEKISAQQGWRHVISPIIRYDFVQAPDQTNLPLFDSLFTLMRWNNLLSGNRYAGLDRIEKSNRFSLILETRLQKKQNDKAVASDILIVRLGESYDLLRQSIDPSLQTAPNRPFSNVLGEIIWQPITAVTLYSSGQYNPSGHYWSSLNSHIRLTSPAGNSLYAGFNQTNARYTTPSRLFNLQSTIKLTHRWLVTANWQYDGILKLSQRASLGVHYQHPCWNAGIDAYRSNRRSGTTTASDFGFSLLLEFKGLGSVGS
ncbi:MAG: LPS assembly protein LptD [Mariprofundus sp.]|nr:LPS assembly protein LptD [Mariprofundus sp.]